MKQYDAVIIGFGKGGKTLGGILAKGGQKVAIIEQSEKMFGGTCINVGCIPSKSIENSSRKSALKGGNFEAKAERYTAAIEEKRRLTGMLRKKNYGAAVDSGVEVLVGKGSFVNDHTLLVEYADGKTEEVRGEKIFINTGSRPFIPTIDGISDSKYVYTSETIMELDRLPEKLVVIGGGYIGLEFASYYANFGSQVTVVQDVEAFIPREDADVAKSVLDSFNDRGIKVIRSAKVQGIKDEGNHAKVSIEVNGVAQTLEANAVLIATGRRPNVEGLKVEAAGIELTDRGAIKTNEHLQTNVPHIHAMGDVVGGLQFTYISLDDCRIVKSHIMGDGSRTTQNRGAVPYSVFLDPPMSRVGMTEAEARDKGYDVKIAVLPAKGVPKAHVIGETTGLLKAVVDAKTDKILGAHFFCAESYEVINVIKVAMDAGMPYTALRDGIFTHPTMTEALNMLFGAVK